MANEGFLLLNNYALIVLIILSIVFFGKNRMHNIEDETYKDQYPVLMSNFVIDMNKREIEKYKTIVNEYCKYNIYKYTKKDPMTCSQERINSLFAP